MAEGASSSKKGFRVLFRRKTNQLYWLAVIGLFLGTFGFAAYMIYTATTLLNAAFDQPAAPKNGALRFDLKTAESLQRLNKVPPSLIQQPPESPSPAAPATPTPTATVLPTQ
jgi:hypothetical protein